MKQLEITESIDEVILSKLHVRSNDYVSFYLDWLITALPVTICLHRILLCRDEDFVRDKKQGDQRKSQGVGRPRRMHCLALAYEG